jgi:xylulokinase
MHGVTLLDAHDRLLRPAIIWSDGRCAAQCEELARRVPEGPAITGNLMYAGFSAPKVLWVAEHEPDVFRQVARVLLPKDYLRLRLSGEYRTDLSDAAGTLWLDVGARRWSPEMVAATGLAETALPALSEGSEPAGGLRAELCQEWGIDGPVTIAGGAGDQAAGAVGIGVIEAGQAFLSLGTSGVYFVASDAYAPNPEGGVHALCHCLPGRWHQMSAILSGASCLDWVARLTGATVEGLLAEVEGRRADADAPFFLPYLSGERTPHNDPHAKGVFFGLSHATTRADLGYAVLEGVALALADGQDALLAAGTPIGEVAVIGGGARSRYWGRILASVLGRSLGYPEGGEVGPAFGAARLARLAAEHEEPGAVCQAPKLRERVDSDPELRERCQVRRALYRRLYPELRESFAAFSSIEPGA